MNGKMKLLAARKKAVSARIARQRLDIAAFAQVLEPSFSTMDKGIAFASYMKRHPLIPAAAAAAFFILKPRRAFGWGKRIWFFWRLYINARRKLTA